MSHGSEIQNTRKSKYKDIRNQKWETGMEHRGKCEVECVGLGRVCWTGVVKSEWSGRCQNESDEIRQCGCNSGTSHIICGMSH